MVALFLLALLPVHEDKAEFPAPFRGTWLLRLTSDDGGKNYRSGGNQPLCEVSATEVKFLQKVDFAAEKLTVKAINREGGQETTYSLLFTNGNVWKITDRSGSIAVIIHESTNLKEKTRFVVRLRK